MQDELVGLDPRHDGPLIRRINAQISSLRAQLAPLLQSLTAQGCFADRPCQQLKNARPVAVDTQVTVRESDHDVDTSIDIQPGDSVFMEADGQIWAGVWLTGDNWPKGWDNVDHDPKFPLHTGDEAHPYSLIAKLGASRRTTTSAPSAGQKHLRSPSRSACSYARTTTRPETATVPSPATSSCGDEAGRVSPLSGGRPAVLD